MFNDLLERLRRQAGGIRGSAGPDRTLSQRAIDRVRRVLAARRHHTENAELAAAIKFTQGGKRRSTPLRTEAQLDRRVRGAASKRTSFRRRKIAPSPADKRPMDMGLIIGAPVGLGVLIALGGILVIMAYLSE